MIQFYTACLRTSFLCFVDLSALPAVEAAENDEAYEPQAANTAEDEDKEHDEENGPWGKSTYWYGSGQGYWTRSYFMDRTEATFSSSVISNYPESVHQLSVVVNDIVGIGCLHNPSHLLSSVVFHWLMWPGIYLQFVPVNWS